MGLGFWLYFGNEVTKTLRNSLIIFNFALQMENVVQEISDKKK